MLCLPSWSCLSVVSGLVSYLGWDAVSAFPLLFFSGLRSSLPVSEMLCPRSCLPPCLPAGLGCYVRLLGLFPSPASKSAVAFVSPLKDLPGGDRRVLCASQFPPFGHLAPDESERCTLVGSWGFSQPRVQWDPNRTQQWQLFECLCCSKSGSILQLVHFATSSTNAYAWLSLCPAMGASTYQWRMSAFWRSRSQRARLVPICDNCMFSCCRRLSHWSTEFTWSTWTNVLSQCSYWWTDRGASSSRWCALQLARPEFGWYHGALHVCRCELPFFAMSFSTKNLGCRLSRGLPSTPVYKLHLEN